ncbi:MAG: DNA internalization-related competence protein ComEC/Rec2 [Desulfobulbaceae bacterium]|jgi:competence protein ComEC|nr:DNA internalization-related competence protein ComEC/Rec2 [Desulfobulbaceae bacterium]
MLLPAPSAFIDHIRLNLLAAAAISYIGGASLAGIIVPGLPLLHWTVIPVFLFFALTFLLRHTTVAPVLLLCAFVLIGFMQTGFSLLPPRSPGHLATLIVDRTKASLTGTVTSMPEYDGRQTRYLLDADSILIHRAQDNSGDFQSARGLIRLTIEGPGPADITAGDHLLVLATIDRIGNYRTPGVFDYRLHMAAQSIYLSGRIKSPVEILSFTEQQDTFLTRLRYLPERVRHRIGSFLDARLDPRTAALYKALLIGSRAGIPEQILEQFKASGCMHLLAISGLHMGLLGLMTVSSLTWLLKRSTFLLLHTHVPTLATLLSLLPLIGYAFIAGMNTPVLRALIMAALFLVGVILRRQRSIIPVIAAAALILLLLRPLALFTVSFQLSFASILAIALIYPRLLAMLEQNTPGRGKTLLASVYAALIVSVAATLGSLPFMLYHFNRISLIGPVMNLLVEPFLCFWALPAGLLAIPLIFAAPDAAAFLLQAGSAGIGAADWITRYGSSLPFASVWTITPNLGQMAAYFMLLGFLPAGRQRRPAAIALSVCAVLLAISFTRNLWLPFPAQKTEVAYLDVGQGSSSLVRLPGNRAVLIDGGSKSTSPFDIGERVIARYLWKKQLWRLDDVIVTHPDSDHFNGLPFIIRRFRPDRLWINGDTGQSELYEELLRLAADRGVAVIRPASGRAMSENREAAVLFLNGARDGKPPTGRDRKEEQLSVNDRSLVIKVRHRDVSFLFPGDISFIGEELLLRDRREDLRSDILLAPHHGSRGSGSPQFIDAVDPRIIVVSSGRNVRGHYLDEDHVRNWKGQGRTVLATSKQGTVTIATDGKSIFRE